MFDPLFTSFYIVAGAAFFLALLVFPFWRRMSFRWGLVDDPGFRKIHKEPTSLAGGVTVLSCGLLCGIICEWIMPQWVGRVAPWGILFWWWGGLILFFALGFVDDLKELRPLAKLIAQLVIMGLVVCGIRFQIFESAALNILLSLVWICVIMNALNFLDNMNGLTCGLGIIIASLLWILAIPAWNIAEFPAFALPALVGAMLGFLCYNYPRAHAFLGDSGSHIVGYIAATTSILLFNAAWQQIQNESWATPWLAFYPLLLILAVPLYDLATTMSIRVWHGKPVYIGDTNHTSHRLVRYGLKPAVAVALLWVAAAITGLLGVLDSDNMLCRLY